MSTSVEIHASKPLKKQVIKLSLCDVYSPKVWVAQTHFWPLTAGRTYEKAAHALREGFGRTISEVSGLAGRTGRTSDDPRDLIITVEKDSTVEFLEEDLTGNADVPRYDELRTAHFPMTGLVAPFSAPVTLGTVYDGAPMVALKLNKLRGGMALSFAFNHLLTDATSIAEIERIWAAHAADISSGKPEQSYKGCPDDETIRQRMSTPATDANPDFKEPHWTIYPPRLSQLGLPDDPQKKEATLANLHAKKAAEKVVPEADLEMPKWCMWHFTPADLARLKTDCSAGLSNGDWVSTNDALVGLFWSRVLHLKKGTQAKREQDITTLLFPVNIRSRLNPPLHPQYLGNAVDIIAANAPISAIEDSSLTGWATAAMSVRKAVSAWKESTWESWLACVKALPNDQAMVPDVQVLFGSYNLAFNDYSRSQSCTLDWGSDVGRAERTRYMKPAGSMKGCATAVIVYPRLADGSLEVATSSTDSLRDALVADDVFSKYAKLLTAFA